MDYYRDVCVNTFETKSKSKLFQSITHNDFWRSIGLKQNVKNPDFFERDEIFNDHIKIYN